MPSAVGFGVLAAHLFCGFVVRFRSHLPRKAKNLRLPFFRHWRQSAPRCTPMACVPAPGQLSYEHQHLLFSRLSLHPCCNRFAVAGVPLTNYPTNANLLLKAVPVPPRGGMGETSPVSLGGYGGVQRGPKGGIAKVPLAPLCKKRAATSSSTF